MGKRAAPLFSAVVAFLLGCSAGPPPLEPTASPRLNEVWQIATHNTYWVNRGTSGDAFASGVEERLLDQVLFDGARAIELDVHRDRDAPGELLVHHTTAGNSLCDTLAECLATLRVAQRALPTHEVITIIIELKELFEPNFDETHRAEDLDRLLERELGALLYRPADMLARCPGVETLSACAEQRGWPTIAELRGRFIVAMLGNWDAFGGQGTRDWAEYATTGAIRERAAFPMASAWKLDFDDIPPSERHGLTREMLASAERQSIFLQIQDLADPRIEPWLERRAILRVDGAFDVESQRARYTRGMQLLQTDYPWIRAETDPARPFAALAPDRFAAEELLEPGARFALDGSGPVRAYWTPGEPSTWEATIVSGNAAARIGCLRAEAEPPSLDAIEACRIKIDAERGGAGAPDAERASVRVTECHAGECASVVHEVPQPLAELVGLAVDGACARVLVPIALPLDGEPVFDELTEICFDAPLVRQGIARPADASGGPSMFFGVRRNGELVRAAEVAGVRAGDRDDPSRLIDLSSP